MSEEQTAEETPQEEQPKETIQEAWEKQAITTEDVAGTKPAEEATPADRQLVAPSIRDFIRENTPKETSGLETEISELRSALDSLRQPKAEETSMEQQMLQKLEALEVRESERVKKDDEAREEEAYNARVVTMKEGVVENIRARKDDYPGLLALEQEETAFNALVGRLQEGQETSEDDVASEIETGLKEVYEKLHKVYGTPSKEITTGSEPKTLSTDLAGSDEVVDLSTMDKRKAQAALWAKHTP